MFEPPIQRLIDELARLPGIGQKSAQRLAFHLLSTEDEDARRLSRAILEMREQVRLCRRCFNATDTDECSLCRDLRRDPSVVCVVQRPQDIVVLERSREFRGRYHVLGGAISPIDGVGPENLRIAALVERVHRGGVTEVIVATNPTVEGETTAQYVARLVRGLGVKATRLAFGLPVGGDLEFADRQTLARSFRGRGAL